MKILNKRTVNIFKNSFIIAILLNSSNLYASLISSNVATYTHSYTETFSNYGDLSCNNLNGCVDVKHSKNITGNQSWILESMKRNQFFYQESDSQSGYQSLKNTNLAYIDSYDWDDAYGSIVSAQANKDANGLHYTSAESGSYSAGLSTFGSVTSYMLYQWRIDSTDGNEKSPINLDIEFVLKASGYAEAYSEGGPAKGNYLSRAELSLFDSKGNMLFTQRASTTGFINSQSLYSNSYQENSQTYKNYSFNSDETYTFALNSTVITNTDFGDMDIEASAYADPILTFSNTADANKFAIKEATTLGVTNFSATQVPEPSSIAIMSLALIGLFGRKKV